jgi:signal transduction histidine kinase
LLLAAAISGIMNQKLALRNDEVIGGIPESSLTEPLFAALSEHEMTLARVARLLHDDVSQILSAAGLQLDALRMDFREAAPGVDQRAAEIQNLLEQAIDHLRQISNELNPSIAERAGLYFALDQMAGKARNTFSGAIRLHYDASARLTPPQAKIFYKIAECALDAAMARPDCSVIDIQFKPSHGQVVLEVVDNGTFQPANSVGKPLGVLLMEYHAARANFDLSRGGSPGNGNILRASCAAGAALDD